jgi:hypothetical protein
LSVSAAGTRFNTPVGSTAGYYYYLGASPNNLYDHSTTPAREYRGSIGTQIQLGGATMVDISFNIARTNRILMAKNNAFTPSSFYIGGQQPNSATAALLATLVPNPFNISNFGGLAGSNPSAYSVISHSTYYTENMTSVGNLVRAYPQMGGFSEKEPLGKSNFQELLFNVTHRWNHGFSLMGSFEINDQHDADYFTNAYDPQPSFEQSNNSLPVRLTIEEVWALPFGRGNKWATSGWENAVFGGFKINSSYEAQPGQLVSFGNLFYIGNPSASQIKMKHPIYVNGLSTGGSNYVQWLNPGTATATAVNGVCTYSGNGFVTNPSCQPNAYNERVFPTHIDGVRARNLSGNQVRGGGGLACRGDLGLDLSDLRECRKCSNGGCLADRRSEGRWRCGSLRDCRHMTRTAAEDTNSVSVLPMRMVDSPKSCQCSKVLMGETSTRSSTF